MFEVSLAADSYVCPLHFPTQVVPDFRGLETNADGSLSSNSLRRFRDRVQEVMTPGPVSDKKRDKAVPLKEKYLANRDNLQALDHAMKLGVLEDGLAAFLPQRNPGMLPEGARRFWVPLEALPEDVRMASPGRSHRCCVQEKGGGARLRVCMGARAQNLVRSLRSWLGRLAWERLYLFRSSWLAGRRLV